MPLRVGSLMGSFSNCCSERLEGEGTYYRLSIVTLSIGMHIDTHVLILSFGMDRCALTLKWPEGNATLKVPLTAACKDWYP
jgi:hypothetical protein